MLKGKTSQIPKWLKITFKLGALKRFSKEHFASILRGNNTTSPIHVGLAQHPTKTGRGRSLSQWDALNVVTSIIPSVMLGLIPSLKLFLYSMTSSGNMLLTWPFCPSMWPPRHNNDPLDHGYNTWCKYLI